MFTDRVALLALSALTLVSAQANSNSTFTIDPSLVDPNLANTWCNTEYNSCTTLCGSVSINNCNSTSLDFECECSSGTFPDLNKYQDTIPWFVCSQLQANCIVENENNAAGQLNCSNTYGFKCANETIADNAGVGASDGTTTSSASSSPTSASQTTSASTSSSTGAAPTANIQIIGNGAAAMAVGLLAYAL
ncbi:hypothetical protein GGR57DRAFT_343935 [Xylariaceae sp. FL1272]|nr:hypothetical protein GGR57DRAFT_343935 [Xylariaceae sp. FL1272]